MRKTSIKNFINYRGVHIPKEKSKLLNDILEKKHRENLEKIIKNPEYLGIYGQVISEKEVDLYDSYKRVGRLDLFLLNPEASIVYYIEYKCFHSKKSQKCAKIQLLKALNFIEEKYHSEKKILLYVSGKFKVKELIKNRWKEFP